MDNYTNFEDKNIQSINCVDLDTLKIKIRQQELKITELENNKSELEIRNKKLENDSWVVGQIVMQYRDYIRHLEETYIEDKDKNNYFRNLYNNQEKLQMCDVGYLYRCNVCNEINPLIDDSDIEDEYVIEIKYDQKNSAYYINKIIQNICHCCRTEFAKNNIRIENYIKKNIEDKNIKKIYIEELINKIDDYLFPTSSDTIFLHLNDDYDFLYIIKHLDWNFLINIKKNIIDNNYNKDYYKL